MQRPLNALGKRGASKQPLPERWETATVANAATTGEELRVTLDSLPEQPVVVKGWAARTDAVKRGDGCLVVRVGDADYWFITWDILGWS